MFNLFKLKSRLINIVKKTKFTAHFVEVGQMGTAKGGMESIIHHTRQVIEGCNAADDFVVAKLDLKNAFNSISRKLILQEVALHFPDIYVWVKTCLAEGAYLSWAFKGTRVMISGVPQGDPLGPPLFCIGFQAVARKIDAALTLHKWYLDDGIMAGPKEEVKKAIECIKVMKVDHGVDMNWRKGVIIAKSNDVLAEFGEFENKSTDFNLEVLGAPIGDEEFCYAFVREVVDNVKTEIHDKLVQMADPQVSTLMLRKCASFCKLVHLARCTPPTFIKIQLARFDEQVLDCFAQCLSINIDEPTKLQVELSASCGGLGLRSVEKHAEAAYIASYAEFGPESSNKYVDEAIECYNSKMKGSRITLDDVRSKNKKQANLSLSIELLQEKELDDKLNDIGKARLESLKAKHASLWLDMKPMRWPINQILAPSEYQTLIKHHLGVPLAEPGECCRYCNATLDVMGHHHITCMKGGMAMSVHNRMRDCLLKIAGMARIGAKKEMGAHGSNNSRPADVLLSPFGSDSNLRFKAVDLTIISPLCYENMQEDRPWGGQQGAVQKAEMKKMADNKAQCASLGWECIPFAMDHYGCFGESACKIVAQIGRHMAIEGDDTRPYETLIPYIYASLQITALREAAKAILAHRQQNQQPLLRREYNAMRKQTISFGSKAGNRAKKKATTLSQQAADSGENADQTLSNSDSFLPAALKSTSTANVIETADKTRSNSVDVTIVNGKRAYMHSHQVAKRMARALGFRMEDYGGAQNQCLWLCLYHFTQHLFQSAQEVRDDVLDYAIKEFVQFVGDDASICQMEQPRYQAVLKEIHSSGNFSTADMLKVIVYWAQRRHEAIIKFHEVVGQGPMIVKEYATLKGAVPAPEYNFKDEGGQFIWNLCNINQSHWVVFASEQSLNINGAQVVDSQGLIAVDGAAESGSAPGNNS